MPLKKKPLWKVKANRASGKAQDADRKRYGTTSDGKTPKYKPRKGVSITASTVHQEKIKQSNQAHRNKKSQFNKVGKLKKENF